MNRNFIYSGSPAHIVFGEGKSAAAGEWVERLGCNRVLVLSTPQQKADAEALAERLGSLAVGVFSGAVMHTPVDVTETAMKVVAESQADCLVSLGGGSTTGLGKASLIALICRRSSFRRPTQARRSRQFLAKPRAAARRP